MENSKHTPIVVGTFTEKLKCNFHSSLFYHDLESNPNWASANLPQHSPIEPSWLNTKRWNQMEWVHQIRLRAQLTKQNIKYRLRDNKVQERFEESIIKIIEVPDPVKLHKLDSKCDFHVPTQRRNPRKRYLLAKKAMRSMF